MHQRPPYTAPGAVWTFIIALALGFLLALLVARTACAAAPSLLERLEPVVARWQHGRKDPCVAPAELAVAITNATKSREWAALLLTLAIHESGMSARIGAGACKPNSPECDHGLAWGLWQLHKTTHNAYAWGTGDLNAQANEASHLARQYFYMCKGSGVPFPLSTIRAFATGRGCIEPLKDEAARVATYNRILSRI